MSSILSKFIHRSALIVLLSVFMTFFVTAPIVAQSGLDTPKEIQSSDEFKCNGAEDCIKSNPITTWLQYVINILTVVLLAGGSVMIAWAGIQYMSARDNAQAVQDAKQKIWNVVFGLIAYFFLYAFLQWLVPGGIF